MQSKSLAKDRLVRVLNQDRIECATDLLEMIKSDLVDTITRYVDIQVDRMDMSIGKVRCQENQQQSYPLLTFSVPVIEVYSKSCEGNQGED